MGLAPFVLSKKVPDFVDGFMKLLILLSSSICSLPLSPDRTTLCEYPFSKSILLDLITNEANLALSASELFT